MSKQVFDAEQLRATHEVSPDTKTVVLRRCWSVVFDVNGNAPSNATAVSCATKELASQVLSLMAAQKNDDKVVGVVIGGTRHCGLPAYAVEGYNFDTYYRIVEDWQKDDNIITSLEGLAELAILSFETQLPDGIVLTDDEDSEEDETKDDTTGE